MPAITPLPPTEELHKLFEYRDGALYWRQSRGSLAKAGDKAGCVNGRGYLVVGIDYRKYLVHRIVWAMHGNEPVPVIDHINCDKQDNRIENLRAATQAENMCNSRMTRRNTSGVKGVCWSKSSKKWIGSVWFKKKIHHTPGFDCIDECAKAVMELRCQLHGEFARHV